VLRAVLKVLLKAGQKVVLMAVLRAGLTAEQRADM
jgi:hypothetical protein